MNANAIQPSDPDHPTRRLRNIHSHTWVVGIIGLLGLIALSFSSSGSLVPIFAAFFAAPFVMLLVRLSRGHFHKDIREKRTKI